MKKFFLILWFGIIFCSTILYFFNSNGVANSETMDEIYQDLNDNVNYVVKNYRGNVAIFANGKDEPLRITNVSLNELPLDDVKLLNKGIFIKDLHDLDMLLEDYLT